LLEDTLLSTWPTKARSLEPAFSFKLCLAELLIFARANSPEPNTHARCHERPKGIAGPFKLTPNCLGTIDAPIVIVLHLNGPAGAKASFYARSFSVTGPRHVLLTRRQGLRWIPQKDGDSYQQGQESSTRQLDGRTSGQSVSLLQPPTFIEVLPQVCEKATSSRTRCTILRANLSALAVWKSRISIWNASSGKSTSRKCSRNALPFDLLGLLQPRLLQNYRYGFLLARQMKRLLWSVPFWLQGLNPFLLFLSALHRFQLHL
jgi:hypothetical protein